MLYIVGLGNPGAEYAKQRHNVGWMALDELVTTFNLPEPVASGKFSGSISAGQIGDVAVTLLYPDTFMNHSGKAVRKLVPKGEEGNLLLIYDDVDVPLGEFKLSLGRGDGGHNGVSSVIASLDTKEFMRLRVGIASRGWFGVVKRPTGPQLPKHVLADFSRSEQPTLTGVLKELPTVVKTIVTDGLTRAMNTYN